MSLQGGIYRQQAMTFLEQFLLYDFITDEPYTDCLSTINSMGKTDKKAPAVLHGYTMIQYEQRKITVQQEQLSAKRRSKNPIYDRVTMPIEGVVLDFEATSIIAEYARIIEISALRFKNGTIIDELHTLVNPDIKIPKSVRDLTGITQTDIEPAPRSTVAMKSLLSFLKGSSVIVGHNISYDYGLLTTFCSKFHLPMWEGSLLCTRSMAKKAQLQVKDYSLDALCKCFGIHNERPHQAWSDTRATFELMKSLYQDSFLI
jgi:DNA polymerase III epsilon subunit-like protein